jgi:hypothetical protein
MPSERTGGDPEGSLRTFREDDAALGRCSRSQQIGGFAAAPKGLFLLRFFGKNPGRLHISLAFNELRRCLQAANRFCTGFPQERDPEIDPNPLLKS